MKFIFFSVAVTFVSVAIQGAKAAEYDPLKVSEFEVGPKTIDIKDAARDRLIPVRIYLPETSKPAPVILFSHGLGGSRDNNPYLGNHWAKRGYVVVFIQHPVPAHDRHPRRQSHRQQHRC